MRVAVVVPAYNAARHLEGVVQRILAAPPSDLERIVVVDDGSRDATGTLARALAARHAELLVIQRPANGGYGAAMKDGLAAAKAAGAEVVATVHADGQYGPELLGDLVTALERRGLDLLQGSRIAG
ncbi:MAG TPA: glycosyltransferase family 2 protein, partial [Polyangia bacterium]|nr:glycosyltransferase family 2 protein [Polyangia bacterium]